MNKSNELKKIERLKKQLEDEKQLNQKEIIEFDYYNEMYKKNIKIKDRREIYVALLEFNLKELEQNDLIKRNECCFNEKTDDVEDEKQRLDNNLSYTTILEKTVSELNKRVRNFQFSSKKIKNFFKNNFCNLNPNEISAFFLRKYVGLSYYELAEYFGYKSDSYMSRIVQKIEKMIENDSKNARN